MNSAVVPLPNPVDPNSVQTTGQMSLDGKRHVPSLGTLTSMVERELAVLITNKACFTSYGVTLTLRNEFPMLEIEHIRNATTQGISTVQELVHQIMPNLMARYNIPYISEDHLWGRNGMDDPNGQNALTYVPYNSLTHGSQVAQAPIIDSVTVDAEPDDVQVAAFVGQGGNVTIFVHKPDPTLRQPVHTAVIDWPVDLRQMLALPAPVGTPEPEV